MLRQTLHGLYERFGIWNGQEDEWPTLFDLYETIKSGKGLNPMAKEATLDRLAALLLALGSTAAYRRGWSHDDLANHNIVFEMAGASEIAKHLLLLPIVLGQFQHRMATGVVNSELNLFVMLDDAQRFLNDSRNVGQGEMPPFVESAGIVRGAGIGLGVAVQTTEGLPEGLTQNLNLKTTGRLGMVQDWRRMGAELGLDHDQLAWATSSLQPGSFIAQLASGSWRSPFAFATPLISLRERVSEAEVDASQHALRQLPTRIADEFRDWNPALVTCAP